jgi:hypothetical protein
MNRHEQDECFWAMVKSDTADFIYAEVIDRFE